MSKSAKLVLAFSLGFLVLWSLISLSFQSLSPESDRETRKNRDSRVNTGVSVTRTDKPADSKTASAEMPSFRATQSDFAYEGWKIDQTGDQPRVCIGFSKPLPKDGNLAITDSIRTSPKARLTAEILDNLVCLSGMTYGKDYELTLLEGLKSAKGQDLGVNERVQIAFGDRPPHVSFAGDGIILPRISATGVAIESVNVSKLEVKIQRVGDRIIARQDPDSGSEVAENNYGNLNWRVPSDVREEIWSGTLDVTPNTNQLVTSVLPINELVGTLAPGAYIIEASREHQASEHRPAKAWRWIIVTDLALTTYQSAAGLDVTVRSIQTAEQMSGIRVDLIARNNEVLASQESDGQGHTHFDAALLAGTVGMAPRMLMAYGPDKDYAILDFNRSPLDLSAFPIGGRQKPSGIDAYAFTERGVYRPGEKLNLSVMLRDDEARAINGRSGKVEYIKPNGMVFRTQRFDTALEGMVSQEFSIPTSAPRGIWQARTYVDGAGQVGSTQFAVEDFVPQKLRLSLKADDSPIVVDKVRLIDVQAEFLYGAPGAGLKTEAETRLRIDPKPFPDFSTYEFGNVAETYRETVFDLGGGVTDGEGRAEFGIKIEPDEIKTSHPLRAETTIGVAEPGGRYITDSLRLPVRLNDTYIGLEPQFDTRVERGTEAAFQIIAVDSDAKPIRLDNAEWRLVEEDWNYTWYRRGSQWQYRRDLSDIEIARGNLDIGTDQPAPFSRKLDWGEYRFEVSDPETGAISASRFSVGWRGSNTSDAPDQIQIAGPTSPVKGGDRIVLSVKSPYAGLGELVIADDKVRTIRNVLIPEGGSEIEITLDDDIGASTYALLSVYTPRDVKDRPVPRRAVGIGPIPIDKSAQTLAVSLDAPTQTKPRQSQTIILNIDNIPARETAYVSLAAVDEGILQITKFQSPNPQDWYFGKIGFGVEVRDDYARLLNPNLGDPAIARTGGDGLGGEGLTVVPETMLSLYHGAVKTKNGQAELELELPDFNGEVRLMAVAWSASAVGSTVKPMVVHDKVPAIFALPRFLAPGDKAVATLSLDNVDGAPGEYQVQIDDAGPIKTDRFERSLALTSGERKTLSGQLQAEDMGISHLTLNVSGPDDYSVTSHKPLEIRQPFRPVSKFQTGRLGDDNELTLSPDLISGLDPASTDITVSFSRTAGVDPTAYARSVSAYPYGCTEQTVSRAMPLLYAGDLGGSPGMDAATTRVSVQEAVDRIANRQSRDGSFGLWRADDGNAQPWIGVYGIDFLQRARTQDYLVDADILDKAYDSLVTMTKMHDYPGLHYEWSDYRDRTSVRRLRQAESAAYAHYVLARAGRGDLPSMRYFYENHTSKLGSPLAWGYLGAALAMMDDQSRAERAFREAAGLLGYDNKDDYYQTPLRDSAGLLALATEVEDTQSLADIQSEFVDLLAPPEDLTTQEKAQIVLALRAQIMGSKPIKIKGLQGRLDSENGIAKDHILGTELAQEPVYTNQSGGDIWYSVFISGSPTSAPPAVDKGYTLTKTVYAYSGKNAVDLARIQQGDRLIVVVNFQSTLDRTRQTVLADLLPAGFEIETILRPEDGVRRDGNPGAFEWLGEIDEFQVAEARDDRLVAATETVGKYPYKIAYVVRAVTQGDFVWPGAVLEDMYRPQDQSISPSTRVVIGAGSEG